METQEGEALQNGATETETHKLIRKKDWNAVNKRLATAEGKIDATLNDDQGRLIFHLDELYDLEVPLQTLQAAHDANQNGFIAPFSKRSNDRWDVGTYVTYPIFLAIQKNRADIISLLLYFHPESARMKEAKYGSLPIHIACELGNNAAAQLLLWKYPAGATTKNNNARYPLLFSRKCSYETQLGLLTAYPDIAFEKMPDFDNDGDVTLLQFAIVRFTDYRIIESIFALNPRAVGQRDSSGDLPIHFGMRDECSFTIELLDLITQGDHNALKEKGKDGMLPLHTLCHEITIYDDDDDDVASNNDLINLFREVLRRHPTAANTMDDSCSLPLDYLLANVDLYNAISPSVVKIWSSLVEVAPESLLQRHQRESPFVSLSRTVAPPLRLWNNAAIYQPTALLALDREREASALYYSLHKENQEKLLDKSSYSFLILESTFRCLRNKFYHMERARRPVIQEDAPVMHMLAYCFHLLGEGTHVFRDIGDDEKVKHLVTQIDSRGNTIMHTLFSAPCPKEKNDVMMRKESDMNQLSFFTVLAIYFGNGIWDMTSALNLVGDLPLHMLLWNHHPTLYGFNSLVIQLVRHGRNSSLAIDSTERLYPFMLAALNVAGREEKEVVSLTFDLLVRFVGVGDMTKFCSGDTS